MPAPFGHGGGCYTGFGHVSRQVCRGALDLMPSHNLSPEDVTEGPLGQVVTRTFNRGEPKIWRLDPGCIIGVSLYDETSAKGLAPLFKEAASLIIGNCVGRSIGGLLRFSHFEVIVFDEGLLPRPVPDYIFDFSRQSENIPFSQGLYRLRAQSISRSRIGDEEE
ncbi:hypothetical protein MMC17_000762 [Xylographa soralifera]|nr:hypothetical protein [Xylographa soralifera]